MVDYRETPKLMGGHISLFHAVVIGLSLTLTLAVWQFSSHQIDRRNHLRFELARDQVLGLISDRMAQYEDALWAGVAAIESHGGDISYQDWKVFAENLRIDERYPGINGIGVIHFLSRDELPAYLARQRGRRPGFRVFPEHGQPGLMPITYIVPEDINAAAVGLDVAHETNRRTAALASRDTGTAQITGPIVLVQDAGKTSGFLFYAPFYNGGARPDTASRRESAVGAVYAPFVVHKLMQGLLAKELRGLRFSIRDAGEIIYDEHDVDDPLFDPRPMFSEEVSLELYGRTWTLDIRTDLAFRASNTTEKPGLILAGGLIIEGLIVALILMMSRANGRAMAYADSVTVELRQEKAKLVATNASLNQTNKELERFAYVASHDLKTPIRGINGLTEMIEEDLADYLVSPSANPAVAVNLVRIRDRVRRMEELTNGIIKISRIGEGDREGGPMLLSAVMSDLALDFGLRRDQWALTGGDVEIGFDQAQFQSVLENLVGNAIKHHDGKRALRIEVAAALEGERLQLSVSDNGPGIDTKHHDRIFEVFQTLGTDDAAGGTGIGLAIVRKAVERNGGSVSVRSVPGEGATFLFDWPHAAGEAASEKLETAA